MWVTGLQYKCTSGGCTLILWIFEYLPTVFSIKNSITFSVGSNPVCGFRVRDFWRGRSSVLVDEQGFGRVRSLVFLNLGMGLAHF